MKRLRCLMQLSACLLGAIVPAFAQERLPAMDADLTRTTVSGFSSGGFMAVRRATWKTPWRSA